MIKISAINLTSTWNSNRKSTYVMIKVATRSAGSCQFSGSPIAIRADIYKLLFNIVYFHTFF